MVVFLPPETLISCFFAKKETKRHLKSIFGDKKSCFLFFFLWVWDLLSCLYKTTLTKNRRIKKWL